MTPGHLDAGHQASVPSGSQALPVPRLRRLDVRGGPREIGRQIGEGSRDLIAVAMEYHYEHHVAMTGIDFARAEELGRGYLAYARDWVPSVVEELRGLAEGSGVPMEKLLVPNCGEEFLDVAAEGHCTSIAISNGRRLLAHNEDWYAGDAAGSVLLRMGLDNGIVVLSVTPPYLLACGGLSSNGLATGGNTLFCNDGRIGVPNNFIRRWMLEAQSLEDARTRAMLGRRARGSNHLILDRNGRICDVETSGLSAVVFDARPYFVHTNHYLSAEMETVSEDSDLEGSRMRYDRAVNMLEVGLRNGEDTMVLMDRILSDHANSPRSICNHPDTTVPAGARECTTSSVIWDVDEMAGYVCAGPPCAASRERISLG